MNETIPAKTMATMAAAIRDRRLLRVVYKRGQRTIEPYLIYRTKAGALILHGWQVAGAYTATPPPDWCNLRLDAISSAAPLAGKFARAHPDYNPESSQFHEIIYQLGNDGELPPGPRARAGDKARQGPRNRG